MKFLIGIWVIIGSMPVLAGSVLDSLKEPLTQVDLYSATKEIEKTLKAVKGDNIVLPTSVKVTEEDIDACQKKCRNSKGIFAQGIDCKEGCTPKAIETAILMAAQKEWDRLKKVRVE